MKEIKIKRLFRFTFLCLLVFLFPQSCAPAPTPLPTPYPTTIILKWPEHDAVLTSIKGTVELRRVEKSDFHVAAVGDRLFNGDVIKTDEKSKAVYVCTEHLITEAIGPNSEISVDCPFSTITPSDSWKPALGDVLLRTSSGKPIPILPPSVIPGDPDVLKEEIIALDLDQNSTSLLLANLYISKEMWKDAINEFENLIDLSPQPHYYQKLGDLYLQIEPLQCDKSEEFLLESIKLATEKAVTDQIANADFNLGWNYAVCGDRLRAAQFMRESYDIYRDLELSEDADIVWSTIIMYGLETP